MRTPRDQSDWGLFSDFFYLKLALRQTLKKKKKKERKRGVGEEEGRRGREINLYLLNRGGLFLSLEKRRRVKRLVNLTTKNK